MPLDHKPPKVIARKGTKKIHCHTLGNKAQITILACANADGTTLPPMVILDGRFNPEWSEGEVPNTLYGMSDKGWTDQELFFYWMTQLFVKYIPPTRPVMLLVDGHSWHYEPETIRAAAEAGIVMFCLPPHSTHVAQPLDVSFFRPLKVYWSEACHKFMQNNPGRVVTKYQFSPLFAEAWYKAIRPGNLVAGFVKARVCPFNPEAIKIPTLPPGVDEGGVSDEDLDGDLHNERQGDDPSMDRAGDDDRAGEDASMLEESHFTHEQIELFQYRYENGYDLYTDTDYVTWLMG